MIQTSALVITEEEQFVLDNRPADRASEHVPTQLRCGQDTGRSACRQAVLPLVRIEDVIAEVLERISVERVRTRLDRRIDDAALKVPEFGRRVLGDQVELLNRIRR